MSADDVLARAAALGPEVAALAHSLIGCSWGRDVATDADPDPCPDRAVKIVILHATAAEHAEHMGAQERELRLCQRHLDFVNGQTKPRAGGL